MGTSKEQPGEKDDEATPIRREDGPAVAHHRGNYLGCFIDRAGRKAIEVPRPYGPYPFSEGMCMIGGHGARAKYGFMDRAGQVVVDPIYDSALSFHDGVAAVATQNKWGFIDKGGRVVFDIKYGQVGSYSEGLAAVRFEGRWGFVDRSGSVVIPPVGSWPETPFFSEGLAHIKRAGRWGYIDKKGQLAIEPQYEGARCFLEGLACVKQGNSWGFIDNRGRWVIEASFSRPSGFSESLALVHPVESGGIRFIDHQGKVAIDFGEWANRGQPVDDVGYFQEGVAPVSVGGKWGFIDKQGMIAVPIEFEDPSHPRFAEGLAAVKKGGNYCFIDKNGRSLIETDAFVAGNFSEGLAHLSYL